MDESKNKLWFRRKRYGWGWFPITWQGWVIVFLYVILFAIAELEFIANIDDHGSVWQSIYLLIIAVVLMSSLIYICYKKGEKPKWSWGD